MSFVSLPPGSPRPFRCGSNGLVLSSVVLAMPFALVGPSREHRVYLFRRHSTGRRSERLTGIGCRAAVLRGAIGSTTWPYHSPVRLDVASLSLSALSPSEKDLLDGELIRACLEHNRHFRPAADASLSLCSFVTHFFRLRDNDIEPIRDKCICDASNTIRRIHCGDSNEIDRLSFLTHASALFCLAHCWGYAISSRFERGNKSWPLRAARCPPSLDLATLARA